MTDLKIVDQALLTRLSQQAASSPRKRLNHNLHPRLDDPIQRLCNAFEPGTYVRPHRHPREGRWELFLALSGKAVVLLFQENGTVLERVEIGVELPRRGIEVPPGTWHTVASLAAGTVLFEVKPGPYEMLTDKDFAPWAPKEGENDIPLWVAWFNRAQPGKTFNHQ